jgi:hypothetical protein
MSFLITRKNNYIPAPEGSYRSVVCDVLDLGEVGTAFGTRHMCRVSFQLDEKNSKGQRFVLARRYTVSLHPASALRGLLTTLLGASFNGESVDLEDLVGVPCLIAVEHSQAPDGNTYSNVASVARLPRGIDPIAVEAYTRQRDREQKLVSQPRHQAAALERDGITADDMPPLTETPKPVADAAAKNGITDEDVPF